MTAREKPTGSVRDIIRRLVSRTMAQQIRTKVEKSTLLFQDALSTTAVFDAHGIPGDDGHKSTVHSFVSGHHFTESNVERVGASHGRRQCFMGPRVLFCGRIQKGRICKERVGNRAMV